MMETNFGEAYGRDCSKHESFFVGLACLWIAM